MSSRAPVSLGCVRMLNAYVRELFDVVEVGDADADSGLIRLQAGPH